MSKRWFRSPVVSRKTHDEVLARSDDYIQRLVQAEGLLHEQGEIIQELREAIERLEKREKLLAQTITRMQEEKL